MSEASKVGFDVVQKRNQIERLVTQLNEIVDSLEELHKGNEFHSNESQLREISKTIANLEQMKIAVPDELRRLKLTLVTKVNDVEEVQKMLRFMDEELNNLQSKVQSGLHILSAPLGAIRRRRRSGKEGAVHGEAHSQSNELVRKFWQGLLALAREKTQLHAGLSPTRHRWITGGSGLGRVTYGYIILQHESLVNLYIDRGEASTNKSIFDELHSHRHEIEQAFGEPLFWQRLDQKRGCRIDYKLADGGYLDDEANWPTIQEAMVTAMVNFERAIAPFILNLRALKH